MSSRPPPEEDNDDLYTFLVVIGSQLLILIVVCWICSCVKSRQKAAEAAEEKERQRIYSEEPHSAPMRMSGKKTNLLGFTGDQQKDKEIENVKKKISKE